MIQYINNKKHISKILTKVRYTSLIDRQSNINKMTYNDDEKNNN